MGYLIAAFLLCWFYLVVSVSLWFIFAPILFIVSAAIAYGVAYFIFIYLGLTFLQKVSRSLTDAK